MLMVSSLSPRREPRSLTHEHGRAPGADDPRGARDTGRDDADGLSIDMDALVAVAHDGAVGRVLGTTVLLEGVVFPSHLEALGKDIGAVRRIRSRRTGIVPGAKIYFGAYFRHGGLAGKASLQGTCRAEKAPRRTARAAE